MPKSLIIVESPAKARTISRFLGEDFIVESSYGHIRDLPRSKLGVDVENNFAPQYVIPTKSRKQVNLLKKEAAKAERIILATDEDREGEAIAWHLAEALGINIAKAERIVFHEITETAIEEALKNPRVIDLKRVDAQQARRILDRLVGYSLSPFLWKKVIRGLSAGRVQSVAVRIIVEREREIQAFQPKEYWTIEAELHPVRSKSSKTTAVPPEAERTSNGANPEKRAREKSFARLAKINNEALDKFAIKNEAEAKDVVSHLEGAQWSVASMEKRAVAKKPPAPFTTSTLQQEAFRRLGFGARQTMRFAQQLYEGVGLGSEGSTGLITYMRTDSTNLSEESLARARSVIGELFGKTYALPAPRRFKTKTKGAQEAHEAVRPTDPGRTPESIKQYLDRGQFRLYDLVWRRFMASQMPEALFEASTVDIAAKTKDPTAPEYLFRASGQTMKFDGFLAVWLAKN